MTATVRDMDTERGGRGVTDGLLKVFEVLGDKIIQCESSEKWTLERKKEAERELNKVLEENRQLHIEVSDLKQQCFDANEKLRDYERTIIIDENGTPMFIKDMPEIPLTPELEKEIQESLDRGRAPERAAR